MSLEVVGLLDAAGRWMKKDDDGATIKRSAIKDESPAFRMIDLILISRKKNEQATKLKLLLGTLWL